MNLEQVGHFIRQPQELQLSHADALKNLASRHPYSSVYALLYLTALANGKSPDLDDALSANAYRLSDRTRLYHLLTGERVEPDSKEVQKVQNDPKVEPAADLQSPQVTEVESGSISSITVDQEDQKVEIVEQVETSSNGDQNPEEISGDQTFESAEKIEQTKEHERKTEAEIGFDFEKITTAHSLEQFLELPEAEEESGNRFPIAADQGETDEKRSFTSWLRSAEQPVFKPAESPKSEEPIKQKPNADELIDKFLKEEPSITRSKTEFFSPSRKAKESLSEDAAPVSETLARIYAAQGNYPKAIHVYHQLMLSVPEKKSLFAVRIEELKKKITQ